MDETARAERYEDYIRLHRDFHLAVAQATDNAVVVATERSFLEYMDHEGWRDMERQSYLPNRKDYLTKSADEHRAIFEAVRSGDGAKASDLVHKHYERHESGSFCHEDEADGSVARIEPRTASFDVGEK